ncbi:hypothetical protein ACHAXT_004118 [Thalassiosira profunda]
MMNVTSILSFFFLLQLAMGSGVPEGWRMTDRFVGFRYQLTPRLQAGNVKALIRDKADALFCFGWVQDSKDTVVGEARYSEAESIVSRDYPDTKIRLHFSAFKVVSPGRNTCFRDAPHKCSHLYFEGEDGTAFRDR